MKKKYFITIISKFIFGVGFGCIIGIKLIPNNFDLAILFYTISAIIYFIVIFTYEQDIQENVFMDDNKKILNDKK